MAANLTAARFLILRKALRAADSAAESLPVLAEMVRLTAERHQSGDDGAVGARSALNQALAYLRAASAELPHGSDDYLIALFLQAEACFLRDGDVGPVSDLDDAIECLRRLRAALPPDDPGLLEVDAKLGGAAFTRAGRPRGRLADVDEAGALLTSVLDRLAPDDPGHRRIATVLAVLHAVRFITFGGPQADRDAALAHAAACLAEPAGDSVADDAASTGHLVIAWMALARQLTSEQRSTMLRRADVESARRDGAAAASLMAELGRVEISLADAETAIGHLRQIPIPPGDEALRGMVPMLWSMALFVTMRAGGAVSDVDRVADGLQHAASLVSEEAPEYGELLAMYAALLAAQSQASGATGQLKPVTDALGEAVARLPVGHPVRSAELELLRLGLGHQVTEADSADDTAARLDEIMTALERMPRDDPGFARAVATVGIQVLSVSSTHRSAMQLDRIVPQLERAAAGLAPEDPLKPFAQCMYWGAVSLRGSLLGQPDIADTAIDELIRCAGSVPAEFILRPYLVASVGFALVDRHAMGGELRHLELADVYARKAFECIDPEGPFAEGSLGHAALLYLRGHIQMVWCNYDASEHRVTRAIDDLERAAALTGQDQPLWSAVTSTLEGARAVRESKAIFPERGMSLGTAEREAFKRLLSAAESVGQDHPEFPALVSQAASGLVMQGLVDNDPKQIDRAVSLIAGACSVDGLAVRERPRLLTLHGNALHTRYQRTGSPRDLSNAIDRLEEARRAVEQELGSPYAAEVLQTLASVYRTRGDAARGDVDRAVTLGIAGLREHSGDVLLQDSDENALRMARRGTSDATAMARWFIDRGRDAAAISALELGRGMVLHAATSGAGVEEALREAGHSGLADEWVGQPQTGETSDLRYRVMLAIERSPAEARLLSAPPVSDIAAALTEIGADALVYLLPRDDDGPGVAMLVDPGGTVRPLRLPGLYTGTRSPVEPFLRARRSVEAVGPMPAAVAAREVWLDALGTLCDWAWRAAIGPVLHAVPARGRRSQRRIVLVPGGELGLVPWHAARRPDGAWYACQEAVFSYASSARQFVEATRRRPRPWAQAPVLISDSMASAYPTAAGVRYLYDEHYRAGPVFGSARAWLSPAVPGSDAAAPGDVLAALPHEGFPGASLLHFGCHGRVQVPVLGSSLKLGEDEKGEEIKVEVRDILRRAREWRAGRKSAADSGGLVVLASCLTDVTEADYDEALTLAAAFLAAGAVGAVAARWTVADAETAVFMTMFHQYLNGSYPSPARALREAQLWMLNPGRELPEDLPRVLREEARMAGQPGGPDLASPAAWAGFAYQGR
jgi:tetratricopeptide (TPR) repeat protein